MVESFGSCGTCFCYSLYLISKYIKVKYSYHFYCALASYCCPPKKSSFFGKLNNCFCCSCAENVLFLQILHNFHYCMNENWASNYLVGIGLLFRVCFQICFWVCSLLCIMLKIFSKISNRVVEYPLFLLLYLLFYHGLLMLKTWTQKLLFMCTRILFV